MKVVEGVHDLAIDSGSVVCTAKLPTMHQDGIQVMGGERITLRRSERQLRPVPGNR